MHVKDAIGTEKNVTL